MPAKISKAGKTGVCQNPHCVCGESRSMSSFGVPVVKRERAKISKERIVCAACTRELPDDVRRAVLYDNTNAWELVRKHYGI